jgi:hypothetical protein
MFRACSIATYSKFSMYFMQGFKRNTPSEWLQKSEFLSFESFDGTPTNLACVTICDTRAWGSDSTGRKRLSYSPYLLVPTF